MGRFKKGDWVRATRTAEGEFTAGKLYQVSHMNKHSVGIARDDSGSTTNGWGEDYFEPWQPKVGERVRYVASYGTQAAGKEAVVLKVGEHGGVQVRLVVTGAVHTESPSSLEPIIDAPVAEQPAALKIEAGRYYKTRDGRKVGPMVIHDGYASGNEIGGSPDRVFYLSGVHGGRYVKRIPDMDLIAEWVDPRAKPAITAATVDAINDEYGPVVREVPVAQQQARFKVGDRVRVTGCTRGLVDKRSMTGTVTHLPVLGSVMMPVHLDGGNELYFSASELSHYQPAIVCKLDKGQPLPASRPRVHSSQEEADAEAKRLAELHKGQEFAVFTMGATHRQEKVYEHEWQRLAAGGENNINAAVVLMKQSGIDYGNAIAAVHRFIDKAV
jgi:hypothetical protein